MSHIKNENILNIAVEAGLSASDIIMEAINKPREAMHKGLTDLVTETDLKSEKIIKAFISRHFPKHSIMAEESIKEENNSDYLWIIDPLDGTTNFVHGYPSYSVSIGVYYKKEPIVGVVIEMPHLKIYSAIRNKGAWCEGIPINCSNTKLIKDSLLITGFGYNHGDLWEKNMLLFKYFTDICHGVRRLGSAAIDICHIAAGQADGFWEFDLHPWDTAAGILIAKESGCRITKLNGLKYNIYDKSILVTNGEIHDEMLDAIKNQLN